MYCTKVINNVECGQIFSSYVDINSITSPNAMDTQPDYNNVANVKKLKAITQNLVKKLRVISRIVFDANSHLPDPYMLPVDYGFSDYDNNSTPEQCKSIDQSMEEDLFRDKIDLQLSNSRTGSCAVFRDGRLNCQIHDLSNESSCDGFFNYFSCYHLMPESTRIIVLDINLKIASAYKSLFYNKARAAPIWDNDRNSFVAMFTVTDFIRFLYKYNSDPEMMDQIGSLTLKKFRNLLDPLSDEQNLIQISPECSLKDAIRTIISYNIHRLPIIDPRSGNVLTIMTNSQIFRFFYIKMKSSRTVWPSFVKQTPHKLGLGSYSNDISIIRPWQTIYDALNLFCHYHIAALPIIDEENKLTAIYARYDVIKLVDNRNFQNLNMTISEALLSRDNIRYPCTCQITDSFEKIMEIIFQAEVHRIFVVDDASHIEGVISLSDILTYLSMLY